MSKLTIEFELSEDAAIVSGKDILVDLGHGVTLRAQAPRGLERINSVTLQVVMDVEGDLHAESGQAPVERVHETPTDGGQQEREDGGNGKSG